MRFIVVMRRVLAGAALALVPVAPAAWASRLDAGACEGLQHEVTELNAAGARIDMQRGPEWAKANLQPDRIDRVARLIALEEQIAFRCASTRVANAPIRGAADGTPVPGEAKAAVTPARQSARDDDAPTVPKKKKSHRGKSEDAPAAGTADAAAESPSAKPRVKQQQAHKAATAPALASPPEPPPAASRQPLAPPAGN